MRVILQSDVKSLGKVGDLVRVKDGYARNFLLPRKLAVEATEKRAKELEHLKKSADQKKKKAVAQRKELVSQLSKVSITFKSEAGEDSDKLFGTITTTDISNELEKQGYNIDRRDIHLETPIKLLGQHRASIKLGEGLEATLTVSVERK
ncbi:MAG: 50S ribosomal protein L9 [Bdellovibrionales bacterium]